MPFRAKKKANPDSLAYCYSHRCESIDYSDKEPEGLYIPGTGKLRACQTKKLRDFYWLFYSSEVLCKAAYNAQKGKGDRGDIRAFNKKNYHNIGLSIIVIWFSKYRRPILNTQAFSLNRPLIGTG